MPRQLESPSTAVERTLLILEAASQREQGLSNAEFSRKLKIPKSSASSILRTLEKHGYLRRDQESGKYRLGVKVLGLSRAALSGVDVCQAAAPILRHLVDQVHITTHLAVFDHGEAVYVEKVDAPGFIKMDTWVGRRMAMHSTAVGKSLAAYMSDDEQAAIANHHALKKLTRHTITTPAKLLKEFERVRHLGYSVDDEENNLGVRCVGAPIFNAQGRIEASIGATGTTAAVTRDGVPRLAEIVNEAARRISVQLGYRGPYPPQS
jgi:DNA-binding IclR family transcriptional regulator